MAKKLFNFYRLRLLTDQRSLFDQTPREDVIATLAATAREQSARGTLTWRLGNLEDLGEGRLFFRYGKTSTRTSNAFRDGNFVEVSSPESPFADVYVDTRLGLVFIGHNAQLAKNTDTVAQHLRQTLRIAGGSRYINVDFRLDPIPDPEAFIEAIHSADQIVRFAFNYSRPNPPDLEDLIHIPLEQTLQVAGAKTGRVIMHGDSLDPQVVETTSRSLAAAGEGADLSYRRPGDGRLRRKSLNKGRAGSEVETSHRSKANIIDWLTNVYQGIRGRSKEGTGGRGTSGS